jgi:hypothetical protein
VENFVKVPDGTHLMLGYDALIFGKAVPGYGNDGVVKSDLGRTLN